jgi:hypothetical protein
VRIFSDKKIFTVNQVYNRRNDRTLVNQGESAATVLKTKHPASIIVLGIVASDGKKCLSIFVPAGIKVNYLRLLREFFLPWVKRSYPKGNYVFRTWPRGPGRLLGQVALAPI